jgi:hypothetical protein
MFMSVATCCTFHASGGNREEGHAGYRAHGDDVRLVWRWDDRVGMRAAIVDLVLTAWKAGPVYMADVTWPEGGFRTIQAACTSREDAQRSAEATAIKVLEERRTTFADAISKLRGNECHQCKSPKSEPCGAGGRRCLVCGTTYGAP